MHQIILLLEFGYFGRRMTHLQNYTFLGPILRPENFKFQSFVCIFEVNYDQK